MLFFLAQNVAPITSSGALDQWASPQGITVLTNAVLAILGLAALVAAITKHAALAQKLTDAHDTIQGNAATIQSAMTTVRGLIQGVESAKSGLGPDASKRLVETIQRVATQGGAQSLLDPLVQSIQSGNTDTATLLKTLQDTMDKLQAAAPAAAPTK